MMDMEMEKEALKPSEKSPNNSSGWGRIITTLLFLNVVMLVCISILGIAAYNDLRNHAQGLTQITNIFSSKSGSTVPPQVAHAVTRVVGAAVEDFFFGDVNGDIADFVTGVLTYNMGSLAGSVANIADSVQSAFEDQPPCVSTLTCPAGGMYVTCQNGNSVWCPYSGAVVDCSADFCLAPYITTVSSIVNSASKKLVMLPVLNGAAQGTPAFSAGLLRLDLLLQWLQSQTTKSEWTNAATVCQTMSKNLASIDWAGQYIDTQGSQQTWDANSQMSIALGYVNTVCNGLAELQTASTKKHGPHMAKREKLIHKKKH